MVGAIALARSVDDPALSDAILESARGFVLDGALRPPATVGRVMDAPARFRYQWHGDGTAGGRT
ncbi:MAG: hypothetical protein WDO24_10875 [Pseudomonadota bacterium]